MASRSVYNEYSQIRSSKQYLLDLPPDPVIVANEGLAWDPRSPKNAMSQCHPGGDDCILG